MPVSSIAQVLLRLFALDWAVTGIIQLAPQVFSVFQVGFRAYMLIPPLIYLVACWLVWRFAPHLSRLVARGHDGEVQLHGVTQLQLHTTMLAGLGVYFTLSSFANCFNWIHFFAVSSSPNYGFHRENSPSYYSLTENGMTLAAGIALILTARRWAEKLCGVAAPSAPPPMPPDRP